MPDPVRRIAGKLLNNAKLLRQDPERFARNLLQFTNPDLFEQRLADVIATVPMHVRIAEGDDSTPRLPAPRLNVLDSAWTQTGMTGGPNTIINLACRVARHGVAVRLVSTRQAETLDPVWFRRHAESLMGSADFPPIDVVSAARPEAPLDLGPGDVFLATHWSTAQQLKAVLPAMRVKRFFYMLQEFEPGFYAWSSNFALALETYSLDFWPIVNEAVLADYLLSQPFGGLSDPATRERAIVFEPAVDRTMFYPPVGEGPARPRRLLFYARPTNTRNMFGLGLLALRAVAADPVWEGWEFLSIGSRGSVGTLDLGAGRRLSPAPWRDYAGYGDTLREADILLCPMISPHTSYPVLEMAACGGLAVTNIFATKTAAVLAALSANIVATPPTVEGLAEGLLSSARLVAAGRARAGDVNLPVSWADSLDPVAARVAGIMHGA